MAAVIAAILYGWMGVLPLGGEWISLLGVGCQEKRRETERKEMRTRKEKKNDQRLQDQRGRDAWIRNNELVFHVSVCSSVDMHACFSPLAIGCRSMSPTGKGDGVGLW